MQETLIFLWLYSNLNEWINMFKVDEKQFILENTKMWKPVYLTFLSLRA